MVSMRQIRIVLILSVAAALVGCEREGQAPVEPPGLQEALSQVTGTFLWRDDLGRYEYSEKARLEEVLSTQAPEEAVPILVECIDDTEASRSSIDGRPVAVGIVCYEALTLLGYYEPTAPDGDVASGWPGHIPPTATPEEMRAAREAWKSVVDSGLFVFN
jgi:hypothetical protein